MTELQIPTTVQDVVLVKESTPGGEVVLEVEAPDGEQPVQLTMPFHVWAALGSPETLTLTLETRCRMCGCTDSEGCFVGCSWAEPGLCTECVS